jgi:predicted Zn finger-like uncharacterized protein
MQIVCPNCTTAYDVKPGTIGPEGRSVRCARCRTVWTATPAPEPAIAVVGAPPPAPPPPRPAAPARAPEPEETVAHESAPAAPAGDEFEEGGTFDWSLSAGEPEADAAVEYPAAEPKGQGAVDDIFAGAGGFGERMEAPSLVPDDEADGATDVQPVAEPDNIETVAARRAPKTKKGRGWKPGLRLAGLRLAGLRLPRRVPGGMPVVIGALAVIVLGLVVARDKVVTAAPQTASLFASIGMPVNLRGLAFENVRTTGEMHEGVPVLIVEGTISNVGARPTEVPRLRFAMRNRAGQEIYAWTSVTGRNTLAPGETAPFRTRLASPPAEGREVSVRFFNRRDALTGMR